MKRLILLLFFCATSAMGQTPSRVQVAFCPDSGATGSSPQSTTPDYRCPLPEPVQAGNAIVFSFFSDNGSAPTFTVTTLKNDYTNTGDTWSCPSSVTSAGTNITKICISVNITGGGRWVNLHSSSNRPFQVAIAEEWTNISQTSGTVVTASTCTQDANGTSITAGSITPGNGDALIQTAFNNGNGTSAITTSFTKGSQGTNVVWNLDGADINDSRLSAEVAQSGVSLGTAAFNPTLTSASTGVYISCVMSLKAASAGSLPSQAFRAILMIHQNTPNASGGGTVTTDAQVNATGGNLIVIAFADAGGKLVTPSNDSLGNSYTCTAAAINGATSANFCYAQNPTVSDSMIVHMTRADNTNDGTFMVYVFAGAAASSFDAVSTGETGTQNNQLPLTTCTTCLSTAQANEMVIGAAQWLNCTATNNTAPTVTGGQFDAAQSTNNNVDGPETVDQNGGWFHGLRASSGTFNTTWTMVCGASNISNWAGQTIAFKAPTGKSCTIALTGAGPC